MARIVGVGRHAMAGVTSDRGRVATTGEVCAVGADLRVGGECVTLEVSWRSGAGSVTVAAGAIETGDLDDAIDMGIAVGNG